MNCERIDHTLFMRSILVSERHATTLCATTHIFIILWKIHVENPVFSGVQKFRPLSLRKCKVMNEESDSMQNVL